MHGMSRAATPPTTLPSLLARRGEARRGEARRGEARRGEARRRSARSVTPNLRRPGHRRAGSNEEYFKALKTGCAYDDRQLGDYESLVNALAVFAPIACTLLALRSQTRRDPDAAAERVLAASQLEVLRALGRLPLPPVPSTRDALLAVAALAVTSSTVAIRAGSPSPADTLNSSSSPADGKLPNYS